MSEFLFIDVLEKNVEVCLQTLIFILVLWERLIAFCEH